jgi:hypothetical protein
VFAEEQETLEARVRQKAEELRSMTRENELSRALIELRQRHVSALLDASVG